MARSISPLPMLLSLTLAVVFQGMFLPADAQPNSQSQSNKSKTPAKRFTLKIQEGELVGVSLKADKARLSDIGAELSTLLKTRVVLGPNMEKQAITVEFYDLTLEQAMRLLAPRAYIDYEIRDGARPKPLGIFLFATNDPDPAKTAVVTGSSQAMIIEGNTEDVTDASSVTDEDDPLQVELDGSYLTVKSKKQPLAAVVMTIAEVLEVPAEIKYDSNEIVDTEIKDVHLEDAIPRLSPNIRLYIRADLSRSERKPLRLVLVAPPEKTASQ
jgi:hypothetical protein